MSYSYSSSALRRARPYIPLIPCPECGRIVVTKTSWTEKHKGWVFYKCDRHGRGCNFFYFELEYVVHLLDENVLTGDAGIEALGWAQDRREELTLRQEEREVTTPGRDETMLHEMKSVVQLLTEVVVLLKIVGGLVAVACVVLAVKK